MLLRKVLKTLLLPQGLLTRERRCGVTFLIYHRIGGDLHSEIDLSPGTLARQLRRLSGQGAVVGLEEGIRLLRSGRALERDRVVLTFDDGYADFYGTVFPLLLELKVPATIYVTTGFVDGRAHSPLSAGLAPTVQPLTWEMLREMGASGLITVGAHSHAHRVYAGLAAREVEEDIERSSELFERQLGFVPRHFAYPRARFDLASEAVVRRRYDSAAVAGGTKAVPGAVDPFRIPRVPVRRSDGMLFFGAKVHGLLAAEERLAGFARAALGR